MIFRVATVDDIPQIQVVRHAVKENRLSNPALVTDADCVEFLTERGKGWVCVAEDRVLGFAIADLRGRNIWALFIDPAYEGRGIGRRLHDTMLDWYFSQTSEDVWLGTSPATRAQAFYRKAGWQEIGLQSNGEVRFEMSAERFEYRTEE